MERPNTVAGLLDKRAEIAGLIKFHRQELQKLVCDLDHVDAAIRLFDPDADLKVTPRRYPTKHRAFKGEMMSSVLRALRESDGLLTSLDITKAQMAERGLKAEPSTVVLLRKRVGACLTKLQGEGVVKSVPMDGPYKGWRLAEEPDWANCPSCGTTMGVVLDPRPMDESFERIERALQIRR